MSSKVLKLFGVAVVEMVLFASAQSAWARHHHRETDTTPGRFDYYLLSLSWSPAFCIQQPDSPECNGPRQFGFIVHGLWPQNEKGWPEHCGDSEIPESLAQGMSDLMPAKKLVYHEWATHGTCSGLAPEEYFALVRRARSAMVIPKPLVSPTAAVAKSPAVIVNAFMKANPRWPADSVVVTCSSQGAPRLREVHVCFDRELDARACSADALREGCRAGSVIIPPIR
jgi:ribonuclease T2